MISTMSKAIKQNMPCKRLKEISGKAQQRLYLSNVSTVIFFFFLLFLTFLSLLNFLSWEDFFSKNINYKEVSLN